MTQYQMEEIINSDDSGQRDYYLKVLREHCLRETLGQVKPGYYSVCINPAIIGTGPVPGTERILVSVDVNPVVTEVLTRTELPPLDWGAFKVETFRQWIKRHVGI
jgi:hypothetical protein